MKELEYVNISNLARVRIAMQIIGSIVLPEPHHEVFRTNAARALRQIENELEAEVKVTER